MAHYQYEGQHFQLPDGLSNEEAIGKIKTHLGQAVSKGAFTPATIPGQEGEAERVAGLKAARAAVPGEDKLKDILGGIGETALALGTGIYSGIQAPIAAGLKRATGMVPDWEKETARLMEEKTYAPRGEKGQDYTQAVGDFTNRYLAPFGLSGVRAMAGLPDLVGRAKLKNKMGKDVPAIPPEAVQSREALIRGQQPVAAPEVPQGNGITQMTDQLLEGWNTPYRPDVLPEVKSQNAIGQTAEQLGALGEQQRAAKAQEMLALRQAAMEQEVARQTSLDQNAAERARQEQAPTGYQQWREGQQQAAEQRIPGDNTPMNMESPYPVDVNQFPQVLQDAPYQHEGGIPYDQPMQDQALPVEVRDALGEGVTPDPFNRYSPQQAANRILREGEHPPINKVNDPHLNRFGQGGAIDPRVFEDLYKFGKSVVRGVDGLLAPVYHGTIKTINGPFKTLKGFSEYSQDKGGIDANGWINAPKRSYPGDLGAWFSSTPSGTDTFAGARTGATGGNVHQVYLNLENPKVFQTHGDFIDWFHSQTDKGQSANYARRQLVKQGYDGIQIKESTTDAGGMRQDFVAFHPEQAKSTISGDTPPASINKFGQGGQAPLIGDLAEGMVNVGRGLKARFTGKVPPQPDTILTPRSEATINAKLEKGSKAAAIGMQDSVYLSPSTIEEVIAKPGKDISGITQEAGAGMYAAIRRNSPNRMLSYTNRLFTDARLNKIKDSVQYITGKEGYNNKLTKLSAKEKQIIHMDSLVFDREAIPFTHEKAV